MAVQVIKIRSIVAFVLAPGALVMVLSPRDQWEAWIGAGLLVVALLLWLSARRDRRVPAWAHTMESATAPVEDDDDSFDASGLSVHSWPFSSDD